MTEWASFLPATSESKLKMLQQIKKKNLKTLSGFQQVCTTLKQQVVGRSGIGLGRWQAHLSSERSRVSSVPQRALCPKRCEPQLRPFLFKCNPGTRSRQSSSAMRDLGSTADPLNGTFLGQEPRGAPVTTDAGTPGWGAI